MKLFVVFSFLCACCFGWGFKGFPTKKKNVKVYNCEHRAPQTFVDAHMELFEYVKEGDDVVTPDKVQKKIGAFADDRGRKFDISPEKAVEMVKAGDVNGDGVLSEKEWIKMFVKIAIKKYMPDFKEQFELFDKNRDLKVTEHELLEVFKHVREVQDPHNLARKIMEGYECDGDNMLDFKEFVGFLASRELEKDKDYGDESEEEGDENSPSCK